MTRRKLKNDTCLLCEFESKSIKDALENEYWFKEMNEEIEKNEKNKTWIFIPRPKVKNVSRTK